MVRARVHCGETVSAEGTIQRTRAHHCYGSVAFHLTLSTVRLHYTAGLEGHTPRSKCALVVSMRSVPGLYHTLPKAHFQGAPHTIYAGQSGMGS